jgi:hypothetical protein
VENSVRQKSLETIYTYLQGLEQVLNKNMLEKANLIVNVVNEEQHAPSVIESNEEIAAENNKQTEKSGEINNELIAPSSLTNQLVVQEANNNGLDDKDDDEDDEIDEIAMRSGNKEFKIKFESTQPVI